MICRGGGDWTAVAVDEVLSIFFLKAGRAAQFFENAECNINSLLSRSVTLQAGKVRSHGVISQAQGPGKIVHCAFSCAQKLKDFPSRAFEQPPPPAYMFH